jgi:hypothetical protein|tara:strand:- start:1788 stop:2036 length:249 start_codon:yes stop_codon:yes gene_type:complete
MQLDPKCLKEDAQLGHSAEGYILPCCMSDHGAIPQLWKEHLKIENVDSIDQILNSKEWISFFEMLKNNPNKSPHICKRFCSK